MNTEQQPTNTEAFGAFVKAQKQFRSAIKDTANPFYKSKYADLSAVWEAASKALQDADIMVTQPIQVTDGQTVVVTRVRYKDGTLIEESACPVVCKAEKDPQAMGSAITYARRYSLASILCLVTDDDDGESAMSRQQQPNKNHVKDVDEAIKKLDGCNTVADLTKLKNSLSSEVVSDHTFYNKAKARYAEINAATATKG